jgi:hypothetical protein
MLDTTRFLWYCTLAVQSLFCLYLIWTKLATSYPTFTASLGAGVLRSLAAMYFMQGAAGARLPLSYTYFWLWSEPLWLLLQVAVVLEVHAKIWKEHKAVLRQTRPLLLFTLLIALVAAELPLRHEATHTAPSGVILLMHFGIQATRYISSVLAIFLVLSAVLFLVVVDSAQASNLFRHERMMAAYFAVYAIAAFLIDMGLVRTTLVNGYFVSAITLCFVAWFSVFQPPSLSTE